MNEVLMYETFREGYGQKDYRGNNTERFFVRWNGTEFVPCDKIGQVKEG